MRFPILTAACLFALPPRGHSADAPPLPSWLQVRQQAQIAEAPSIKPFHDFRFTDQWQQSGIRFEHRAVEDANKHYKPVHYDHGSGIAIADVDGDKRLDIYFVNQIGGGELWRNLGGGSFSNITPFAGVALKDRVGVGAAFADIDNDGDPDLFVTTVRAGNALFENMGGGRFRNITAEAGLEYSGHSSSAVFADFDGDGLLDLYVCNVGNYTTDTRGTGGFFVARADAFKGHLFPERYEAGLLYKNLGARKFQKLDTRAAGLEPKGWSGEAAFADLNNDGRPDLYVASMQGDNHCFENLGSGKFAEKTAAHFPKTPWGAMGLKFFDANQDGALDLYVTDMHSDMTDPQVKLSKSTFDARFEQSKSEAWCTTAWTEDYLQGSSNNIFGNALFLNRGGGAFAESSQQMGVETFWPWGPSVGDLNADGFEDIFVTAGMGFGFRYAINSLLLNDAGQRFHSAEFICGVEPRAANRLDKVAFVLDASGADRDHPLSKGQTGRVPIRETLSSRSSAIFDIDDDGDLDIVTNELNDRPQVLVSDASEKKKLRWLKVALTGSKSNRQGLGAIVRVRAGGKIWTQQNDGKSGYLAQSAMPLYIGLGEEDKIDSVEVQWPSGKKQNIDGVMDAPATLEIREP